MNERILKYQSYVELKCALKLVKAYIILTYVKLSGIFF